MTHALTESLERPCRIAWLVRGDERYGVHRAVLSLVTAVLRQGHQPIVICLEDASLGQACEALGAEVRMLALEPLPALAGTFVQKWRAWSVLRAYEARCVPAMTDALRPLNVDMLHVLWPNLVGVGGAVARQLSVPCLWELPNVLGTTVPLGLSRWYYQWRCWREGVTPLANSAYTAASLGCALVRPHVLHLGVDETTFNPQRVVPIDRSELGIGAGAIVLGIVARIDASKGQDRVLDAMLALVREGADLHLLLLGEASEGEFKRALQSMAAEAGAADRLHMVGEVTDPQRYYGAMDVAINSRVDAEPFGLSVVEAMMMGRPVAVHALGGPAETVRDGETGWHVHDASTHGWTAALQRILADRPHWRAWGEAARTHALERFTLAAQADRYLAIVREQLAAPQNRSQASHDMRCPFHEVIKQRVI